MASVRKGHRELTKIATRLALLLTAAAVAPLLAYGAVSIVSLRSGTRETVIQGNQNVATQAAEQIELYVSSSVNIFRAVGAELQQTGLDPWQQDRILKNFVLQFPEFKELTLLDENGRATVTSRLGAATVSVPGSEGMPFEGVLMSRFSVDNDLLPTAVVAVALALVVTLGPARSQPEGVFIRPESYNIREELSGMEDEVYGRQYQNDGLLERINRLETSLFGNRQRGSTEDRYHRLATHLNIQNKVSAIQGQLPLVEYLEQKLFQRAYVDDALANRLTRLEQHMFGRPTPEYPLEIRIKKLTYAMPIVAKSVRMSWLAVDIMCSSSSRTVARPSTWRSSFPAWRPG